MKLSVQILLLLICLQRSIAEAQTLRLATDAAGGQQNDLVLSPVRCFSFEEMISMQGTLEWDTAVATFDSVMQFGLPGMSGMNFGTGMAGDGKLTFSWNDNALQGVSLADSAVLFALRFRLTGAPGSATPLAFSGDPTALEFVDTSFAPIPFDTSAGLLAVEDTITARGGEFARPGLQLRLLDHPSAAPTVELRLPAGGEVETVLFDLRGNELKREKADHGAGTYRTVIDGLPSGPYLLSIHAFGQVKWLRIIIENH